MLKSQDLHYIEQKLGLTPKITAKITEDPLDADLVLNELSIKDIKREDANKISALTYLKLLVFRYSHDTDFKISEKEYVAKSVYLNFTSIKKEIDYRLLSPQTPPDEKKSQYFLVLAGFYYNSVKPEIFSSDFRSEISKGFRPDRISDHVDDWVYILREIDRKSWLS